MSEQFTLKVKVPQANASLLKGLGQLATALSSNDYSAVRQALSLMLEAAALRHAEGVLPKIALPCSEYAPAGVPFQDALGGALEDAEASLTHKGKAPVSIELRGWDNGSADAAVYFLALLACHSTPGLEAKGKGFTWLAQWGCDTQGVLQVLTYSPLVEGRKVDPKAREKLQRRVEKENRAFLQSPFGELAPLLTADQPIALIHSISAERWGSRRFTEWMDLLSKQPRGSGFSFGVLGDPSQPDPVEYFVRLDVYFSVGGTQSFELIVQKPIPEEAAQQHFATVLQGYTKQESCIGIKWSQDRVHIEARTSYKSFHLIIRRLPDGAL